MRKANRKLEAGRPCLLMAGHTIYVTANARAGQSIRWHVDSSNVVTAYLVDHENLRKCFRDALWEWHDRFARITDRGSSFTVPYADAWSLVIANHGRKPAAVTFALDVR